MDGSPPIATSVPKASTVSFWVIFCTLFLTYAYFPIDIGPDPKVALIRAIVEQRTTRIDKFQPERMVDKAYFRGHYYSDKAPGESLLAVPIYAFYRGLLTVVTGPTAAQRWLDKQPRKEPARSTYLNTLAVVALPSALAGAFLFVLTNELVRDQYKALFATAAYGLGSLMFPYSIMLFTHALSAALLFFSFGLVLWERLRTPPHQAWRTWPVLLSGVAAGYAAITEFATAIPLLMIGLYVLSSTSSRRSVLPYLLGTLVPVAILAAYNWFSFGNIAAVSYAHEASEFTAGLSMGFMGVTYPKPAVLYQILFGFYRGFLPLSPVLILGGIGIYRMWAKGTYRREAILCGSIVLFLLLFNASYFYWDGGYCFGPRFVVPMLPFACFPIAFGLGKRWAIPMVLLAISIFHMLAGATLSPLVPNKISTLFDYLYPRITHGIIWDYIPRNLGVRLGLHGRRSVLPLLALWSVAGAILVTRREIHTVRSSDHAAEGG